MGLLRNFRDAVNLFNRTQRQLAVRYDGEDILLDPGDNPGFPRVAVPYARKQNVLMGSQHPINPVKFISLVGVKVEQGEKQLDDISPITEAQIVEGEQKLERVDRSGDIWGEPMEKRQLLRKRGFDAYEAQIEGGSIGDFGGPNV